MGGLMDKAKQFVGSFYQNGEWVENPVVVYGGKKVDDSIVDFFQDFFKLMLDSKYLSDMSKMYITSTSNSMKGAITFYNLALDDESKVNVKSALSKINYDKTKLKEQFDEDLFYKILSGDKQILNNSIKVVESLNRKYLKDDSLSEHLIVRIPKDAICSNITDDEFDILFNMLTTYSKKHTQNITSIYGDRIVGYYNYLISSGKLSNLDKERLGYIENLLK